MNFKVGDKVKLVGDPQSVRAKSALYGQIATIRKIDPNAMYPYALEEPHDFNIWRDTELELVEQPKIVITTDGEKYVTAKLYDGDTVKVAQAMCAPEDTFDFMVGAKLACERLSPKKEETEWRVVNRPVKDGDYIRLTYGVYSFDNRGDILKVSKAHGNGLATVYAKDHPKNTRQTGEFPWNYLDDSYVVIEKVTKTTEPPKPKYYNGKVVCVKSPYAWFTVGKVYEVKNGIIFADDRTKYPKGHHEPYRDVEDVRHAGCSWNCNNGRHNFANEFIPLVED